jgi:hypothetical protein
VSNATITFAFTVDESTNEYYTGVARFQEDSWVFTTASVERLGEGKYLLALPDSRRVLHVANREVAFQEATSILMQERYLPAKMILGSEGYRQRFMQSN